ncbi:ATP-binding protein [uncultured Mesonia sp.]|uniref:DNA polymerase III subunit n=1 Tax=uncultured Mesonia sp. TaxID=399731 RepID=UPI00374E9537
MKLQKFMYFRFMDFSSIIGLDHIKNHLQKTASKHVIPHAQLFVGSTGFGTLPMALAYAQYILSECGPEKNKSQAKQYVNDLSHPDLHFVFPSVLRKANKKQSSKDYQSEWKNFIQENLYADEYAWNQYLDEEKKQGIINVRDAENILKDASLKSFSGGYKVFIIWGADKMNNDCANKLLKLVEEPPSKTVLLLLTAHEDRIISTIKSRCQVLHFPPLGEAVLSEALIEKQIEPNLALQIAQQAEGDFQKALKLINQSETEELFEKWFITWVRAAFRAKGNKTAIKDLINWSTEVAQTGRETQKQFLLYCLNFFRQALLLNYSANDLVHLQPKTAGFKLKNFAPFIHGGNIIPIQIEIEKALYHIERNGNDKLILTDLSIQLTRLIHKKEQELKKAAD